MYKLYTDKQEIFECDIQLEGASLINSTARLIIETEDLALLFKGNINASGKCTIPVKKLKGLLGESAKGNIKLEVIAEDTYFTPWESQFEVDTSKKVTVEVKSQQTPVITEETKPTIKVENIKEEVSLNEKDHVINLLKLLIKEDINFKNISYKRNTLNNIVATYMEENPIQEETKPTIMEGVIKGLLKKTK
tara:strand:+ start:218 stop:793 length:576 start_codon:yes stop_codon:yes gene_type:complete